VNLSALALEGVEIKLLEAVIVRKHNKMNDLVILTASDLEFM
jgi:hypothetical protein